MQITYSAFGGVEVIVDGVATAIGRAREREVLATLLAAQGAPVSADRLATEIWGADAGTATLPLVQVAVSRLRSLLEPQRQQRGGQLIVSEAAGYVLRADTADVDVWRFEELAGEVLGGGYPPVKVAAMCEEAAGLWAEPYAGTVAPGPQRHADRLIELHADLQLDHGRALLDLGRPDAVVRLLAAIAQKHPFREPLWCLLALAQYRSGRQGDALATIRQLRTAMVDELGVDPVPRTLELEEAFLRQDPALLLSSDPLTGGDLPVATERVVQAGSAREDLFGRADELAVGVGLLDESQAQQRMRLLVVTGEGGIGKTAYLDALQAESRRRGFEVLVGNNHPDDLAPALWPWTEVVRPLHEDADPVVWEALQPVVAADPSVAVGATPVRTFDAVVALLRARAARGPLLLVIEDLHWADTASLHLLRHLAQSRLDVPIVVAVSRRSTEEPAPPLLDCLAALARAGVARVHLDGLPDRAVGELLETVVGSHDATLDSFVSELTAGNPFFVLQYAGLLSPAVELDDFDPSTLTVPESITDVLGQRFRGLPDDARTMILAAAVFGRSFEAEALAALVDEPLDDVLDALDLGQFAGLVEQAGASFTFVHSLAQDCAYRELTPGRRIRLHDRAALVLEGARGHSPDVVSAIAHHTWLAAGLSKEHRERAVAWRVQAAGVALSQHAADEALELWRGVLTAVATDTVEAAEAHGGIAVALMQLSRIGEASHEIEAGVRIACRIEEWDLLVELVATLAAAGPWAWPTHGRHHTTFLGDLRTALPHIQTRARALLLAVLEVELFTLGRDEDRGHYADEALTLALAGDEDLRRRVLLFITVGTTAIWAPPRRLEVVQELLDLEPTDDLLVSALLSLAVVEWENRHPEAADEAMERGVAEARRLGTAAVDLPHAWWKATRARDRGDLDAELLLSTALDLHDRTGVGSYLDAQVLAAVHRSRDTGSAQLLRDCPTPVSSTVQAILAHALLEFGETDRARPLMELWSDQLPTVHHELVGACFQVLVFSELGSPEQIRTATQRLERHRGFALALSALADHCGVVDHFLAVGYAALGDPRATEAATEALKANQELGCAPWAERSEVLLASLVAS